MPVFKKAINIIGVQIATRRHVIAILLEESVFPLIPSVNRRNLQRKSDASQHNWNEEDYTWKHILRAYLMSL